MKDLINGASAFIFDLEGVVLDTETIWDEAQRILLSRRGHDYNRAALKHQLTGLGAQQAIAALVAHYRLPDDPSSLLLERWEIMAELLSQGVNYIPGALDFVRHAAVVVDICAATSMDPSLLDIALSATDLRADFSGPIFTSADVNGVAKPAPDIFLYAASKLGFELADCLVVEDAPHGIAAARAAGIPCIALCTTHKRYRLSGADMIFSDWSEVPRPSGLGRDQGCVENT